MLVYIPCTENCKLIAFTQLKLLIAEVCKFDVFGIWSHICCVCVPVSVQHCTGVSLPIYSLVESGLRKMKTKVHLEKVITSLASVTLLKDCLMN